MTTKQKLAARYLAGGMDSKETAKYVGVQYTRFKRWMSDFKFKKYVEQLENHYLTTIDSELVALKMAAFRAIREAIEQKKDMQHREWGVNKVFQIENFKETAKMKRNTEINVNVGQGDAFQTKEQKELSKALLRTYREEHPDAAIGMREGQA